MPEGHDPSRDRAQGAQEACAANLDGGPTLEERQILENLLTVDDSRRSSTSERSSPGPSDAASQSSDDCYDLNALLERCEMTCGELSDPFDGKEKILIFSKKPVSPDEVEALQCLATSNPQSPLARAMQSLLSTIRCQRQEVSALKTSFQNVLDKRINDERDRHLKLERRRSVALNELMASNRIHASMRRRLEQSSNVLMEVARYLQRQNERLQQEAIRSQAQYADAEERSSELIAERSRDTIQMNELRVSNQHLKETVEQLREQQQDHSNMCCELEERAARAARKNEVLRDQMREREERILSLEHELKAHDEALTALAALAPESNSNLSSERDPLEVVRQLVAASAIERTERDSQIQKLQDDVERLTEQCESRAAASVLESAKRDEQQAHNRKLQDDVKLLNEQRENLVKASAVESAEREELQAHVQNLQGDVKLLNQQSQDLDAASALERAEREALYAQIQSLQDDVELLNKQCESRAAASVLERAKRDELQAHNQELQNDVKLLNEQREDLVIARDVECATRDVLQAQIQKLEDDVKVLRKQRLDRAAASAVESAKCDELQAHDQKLQDGVNLPNEQREGLVAASARESAKRIKLQAHNQQLQEDVKLLIEQRERLVASNALESATRDELQAQNQKLQKDLKLLKEQRQGLQNENESPSSKTAEQRNHSPTICRLVCAENGYREGSHLGFDEGNMNESLRRRLSEQLGCSPGSMRELIERLVQRLEDLVSERVAFQNSKQDMQRQAVKLERELHLVRAEMASEISALKAELLSTENELQRAVVEREQLENQLVRLAKYEEEVDSTGEHRTHWPAHLGRSPGDRRDSQLVEMFRFMDYRESSEEGRPLPVAFSTTPESFEVGQVDADAGDYELWKDPSIAAAIQSLHSLIKSKDSLLGRNKELKARLKLAVGSERSTQSDNALSMRALAIQQGSSNEELCHMLGIQERLIGKLLTRGQGTCSCGRRQSQIHALAKGASDDAIRRDSHPENNMNVGNAGVCSRLALSPRRSVPGRKNMSHTIEYLQEQLNDMRGLYEERSKVINHLQGTIRKLESRSLALSTSKKYAENDLRSVREEHETWIHRVASIAGLVDSTEAIEVFIRGAVLAARISEAATRENFERFRGVESRLTNALAQKRFLLSIIDIYRSKYRIDIFATTSFQKSAGVKFRRVANAVVACLRVRSLAETPSQPSLENRVCVDVSKSYNAPCQVNVTDLGKGPVFEPSSAVLALSAARRLETVLADREGEISKLQAEIVSLAQSREPVTHCRKCRGDGRSGLSADCSEEIVIRQTEHARLLEKSRQELDTLRTRLCAERQKREAAEDAAVKTGRQVIAYKKKLIKAREDAGKRGCGCAYRSAVLSLAEMARNAADSEKVNRSSIDTVRLLAEADSNFPSEE